MPNIVINELDNWVLIKGWLKVEFLCFLLFFLTQISLLPPKRTSCFWYQSFKKSDLTTNIKNQPSPATSTSLIQIIINYTSNLLCSLFSSIQKRTRESVTEAWWSNQQEKILVATSYYLYQRVILPSLWWSLPQPLENWTCLKLHK